MLKIHKEQKSDMDKMARKLEETTVGLLSQELGKLKGDKSVT